MSVFIAVLSRVLLSYDGMFFELLEESARAMQSTVDDAMKKLVESFSESVDCLTVTQKRKAVALAACKLLTLSHPVILCNWDVLINIVVDVSQELKTDDLFVPTAAGRDKASLYKMLRMGRGQEEEEEEHSGKEYENNPELKRRARLESEDPIQTISLEDTLRMSLEEAQSNLGMDDFNRTLGSVDESLRSQLTALLSP
eukprot:CAMPEP_0113878880 /NCGR_PEP_ID=MMETSP0780_2-20120614/6929_1 /TAXON_ID=652834 /ORGANISM="Palpitomonas bilix" /LENGTH=198 /DNA_ID=CAMNT_0000865401 /DNA_START=526 /DNA_END=1122 /DNA_ORIENTATION=- /assembly_acc=CAM_ASM_000599